MNAGDFKSKSGTRIINLLVPMAFRSSPKVIAEMVYELRKVGTSLCGRCEEQRDEAIHIAKTMDCFARLIIGLAFARSGGYSQEMK